MSATFYVNWKGPTLYPIDGKMANVQEMHILARPNSAGSLIKRLLTIKIGSMAGSNVYRCPTPCTLSMKEVERMSFAIRAERGDTSINLPLNNIVISAIKAYHTYLLTFICAGGRDAVITVSVDDRTEEFERVRREDEQQVFYKYYDEKMVTHKESLRQYLLLRRTAYQGGLDAALAAID